MNRGLKKILLIILHIGMGCASFFLLSGIVLAALWRAWFLGMLFSLGFMIVLPFGVRKKALWFVRIGLAGMLVIFSLIFISVPFSEIQARMEYFRVKLIREDNKAFTFEEKLGIYGANIAMGIGGYMIGTPEVAKETLLLCIPGPKERRWSSDFAMRSKKIKRELSRFALHLNNLPPDTNESKMEKKIAWSGYFEDSPRVSLALNAFRLSAKAYRVGNRWRINCSGWVPVRYPSMGRIHLFTIKSVRFYVEEGLFWALQQEGWLFPYKAIWSWTIYSDDECLIQK